MTERYVVMFDFDGVLIDSYDATYKIMREEDATITRDDYRNWFTGNAAVTLKKKLSLERIKDFFAKYAKQTEHMPLVPGMKEVVVEAAQSNELYIVSSSNASAIKTFLIHHKLDTYFTDILGYEAGASKEEKIKGLLKENNIQKENCLFITDTSGDIKEAQAVGILTVGVTWGYHSEAELERAEPNYVAKTPAQLLPLVRKATASRLI